MLIVEIGRKGHQIPLKCQYFCNFAVAVGDLMVRMLAVGRMVRWFKSGRER
jgi:hypothetical protein